MFLMGCLCARLAIPLIAVLIFACTVFQAAPAFSGAWPRNKGAWFLSFHGAQDLSFTTPGTMSTYLEYGLADRWTVGGQLEYTSYTFELKEAKAFVRWHPQSSGAWQKAFSLTLMAGGNGALRVAPAFHLGRGLETPFGGGWTDISFRAEVPLDAGSVDFAAFAQLGIKPHDRLMAMLSVDIFANAESVTAKLLPSLAWRMKEGRHLQVEWTEPVVGNGESKLSLGVWIEF